VADVVAGGCAESVVLEAGDWYGPGDRVGRLMVGRVGSIAVVPRDAGVGMVMTGVWWRSGVCVLATEAGDRYGLGDRVGRLMVGRRGSIAVVPRHTGVGMVMTGVWWRSGVCVLATVVKGP
jgi:hypothetical protein